VRQALVILEREGLVRADRWRGAIVTPLDVPFIKDLYAFRGAVERYVAETLASRTTFEAAPVRDLVRLGKAAAKAGDLNRLMELDLRFHTRLYDMVGNRVLTEVMSSQWTHARRVMAATLKESGYSQTAWDEHAAIVDAIEAHDVALAGTRAAAHMAAASARLVETFARELDRTEAEKARQEALQASRSLKTGRGRRPAQAKSKRAVAHRA
jgi:DNA-binding GntR family transcriptional regulator